MKVGILTVELHLNESMSLKDKRRVIRRLKDRVRNTFNASVAEVGEMDKWQKAVLGIVVVSNNGKHLSGYLDSIMNFIFNENRSMVLDYTVEVI